MSIFKNIINHKINTITGSELLKYAKQFRVSLTREQANQIAAYLKGKNIDIFNPVERKNVVTEIARIAGADTAQEINRLFENLTK